MGKNNHNRRASKETLISNEITKNRKPMTKEQLSDATGLRICVIDTVLKKRTDLFKAIQVDGIKKWTLL